MFFTRHVAFNGRITVHGLFAEVRYVLILARPTQCTCTKKDNTADVKHKILIYATCA
jgi:hypothetical protein